MISRLLVGISCLCFLALVCTAFIPLGLSVATDLAWALAALLLVLAYVPGRVSRLFFITLCTWVVLRYVAWRIDSLPLEGLVAGIGALMLLCAELYGVAMLLLTLFVNAYPMDRDPPKLPADDTELPFVDIYIPTYSESIEVVLPTMLGALDIEYPASKFSVYVLDDGAPRAKTSKDPEIAHELTQRALALQAICAEHGAHYLTRDDNAHAKSGNMNAAMRSTKGELILILDADHVPTRDILRNTVGFFLHDKKLAFVQTPHFFVNADPVEKNLGLFNRVPAENDMFYRVVQRGLDLWNTSFFCGSAAVLRRAAVDDIGGFAVDSITEDASTSVKMHRRGWRSAYYSKPMVAGLQPETFAGFVVQRLRWAMGMVQIFVKQNPLLVGGLSLPQRLSYLSVMAFWFFPFARMVFFLAPVFSVFLNLTVYPIGTEYFVAYTLPYLIAVFISAQRSFGRVRRILMSELYETLQTFYTLPAIIATLLAPNKPTFKVTPKGEKLDKVFLSELNKPFYVFFAVTAFSLATGLYRFITEESSRAALTLSVVWLSLNFFLLCAALGVIVEQAQRRNRPRIVLNEQVMLTGPFGSKPALMVDANENGALVRTLDGSSLDQFNIVRDGFVLPCKVVVRNHESPADHPVLFEFPTPAHRQIAVRIAYGSSARWEEMWKSREQGTNAPLLVVGFAFIGIRALASNLRFLAKAAKL